jgi:hypothetical protein
MLDLIPNSIPTSCTYQRIVNHVGHNNVYFNDLIMTLWSKSSLYELIAI